MRRPFLLLALVGILLLLFACDSGVPESTPTPLPVTETPQPASPTAAPATSTARPSPTQVSVQSTATQVAPLADLTDSQITAQYRAATLRVVADMPQVPHTLPGWGSGSGVVYSAINGLVVTSAHLVEGASDWRVYLPGGGRLDGRPATIAGVSMCDDLAVLRVRRNLGLAPAPFGGAGALKEGAHVLAMGYPDPTLGADVASVPGTVSNLQLQVPGFAHLVGLLQTSLDLKPGESGGPLFNSKGQVVGINLYEYTDAQPGGTAFTLARPDITSIIEQLSGGTSPDYTGLNVFPNVGDNQHYYGTSDGLVVAAVAANSPAGALGVQPGDLLVAIDGVDITSEEVMCAALGPHKTGDEVKLQVRRIASSGGDCQVLEGTMPLGDGSGTDNPPDTSGLSGVAACSAGVEPGTATAIAQATAQAAQVTVIAQSTSAAAATAAAEAVEAGRATAAALATASAMVLPPTTVPPTAPPTVDTRPFASATARAQQTATARARATASALPVPTTRPTSVPTVPPPPNSNATATVKARATATALAVATAAAQSAAQATADADRQSTAVAAAYQTVQANQQATAVQAAFETVVSQQETATAQAQP